MRPLSLLVSLGLATACVAAEPDKDGFVPMFNGKDLTGWVNVNTHPGTFFVKDGMIVTTGKPTGFLRTEKQYENFVADFEWMHLPETPGAMGNSGFFVWADPIPAVGTPYTRGIEVQVLVNLEYRDKKTNAVTATSHGDLFSIHGATCKPDRPHPLGWARCLPSENRAKGAGEWNHYRVEAKDGRIALEVNGKVVSGVSDCQPRKGYLALESEGSECRFRNLKIKELPSTNPKPDEVANEAQGHKSLFNGLELDGWKADGGAWKAAGGHLRAAGKGDLVSEKTFKKFELVFDCRMPVASKAEWAVEFGAHGAHAIANPDTRGKWTRVAVTVGPDEVSQKIDGRPVGSVRPGVGPGPIRFKPAEGLEIMNVFVREMK